MKFNLYVIFDKVAQEAGVPFDAKNDEIAIRKFEEVINRQIRPVKTVSVSDYELILVGSFDSETCLLSVSPSSVICNGSDVKEWIPEQPKLVDEKLLNELSSSGLLDTRPVLGPQLKSKKKHFWSK